MPWKFVFVLLVGSISILSYAQTNKATMPDVKLKSDHGIILNDSISVYWGGVRCTYGRDTVYSDSAIANNSNVEVRLMGNVKIISDKSWNTTTNELTIRYVN